MLVLSRKQGESIVIDDRIILTVSRVSGNRVTVGIEAPDDVRVLRGELRPYADAFAGPAETPARPVVRAR